jgi:hypothetical protein
MRKFLLILLISSLLAGCSVIPATKPTMTSEEMATRVALLLTSMPTSSGEAANVPAANQNPSLPMDSTPVVANLDMQTQEVADVGNIATPTTDETAFAAFLGPTATGEAPLVEIPSATPELATLEAGAATATPPIAMPSDTPTITPTFTVTPGGTPIPGIMLTATFTASDPRSLLPVATWTDTMDNGNNWPKGSDLFTAIDFQNGFMDLTGLSDKGDNGWRLAINDIDNAYIEATAKFGGVCHGLDKWGIMLRVPDRSTADRGYWFSITCDGKYAFQKWNANPPDKEKAVTNLIAWTSDSNIRPGANAVNRIGVLAKGSQFTLFINGKQVGETTDGSFGTGGFGILIGPRETKRFNIYVDEMSYWLNPPL